MDLIAMCRVRNRAKNPWPCDSVSACHKFQGIALTISSFRSEREWPHEEIKEEQSSRQSDVTNR